MEKSAAYLLAVMIAKYLVDFVLTKYNIKEHKFSRNNQWNSFDSIVLGNRKGNLYLAKRKRLGKISC